MKWQISFQKHEKKILAKFRSLTINASKSLFLWEEKKLEDPSQTHMANFNLSMRPSLPADV